MRTQSGVQVLLILVYLWMAPAGAQDQLEQEPILIKGNQGLPRTLYIAPWKRVGVPLASDALEGGIGEELQPLERDLFLHQLELRRQGYSVDSSSSSQVSATASDTAAGPRH